MKIIRQLRKNVIYPLLLCRSGDSAQLRWLAQFNKSQFSSLEQIHDLQLTRLKRLLTHASLHCPGYRERFQQCGLIPAEMRSLAELRSFPILEKRDVQEDPHRFVAHNWPRHDLVANQTGGSTGTPIRFFLSNDRRRSRAAATLRHNRWAGWDVGDRAALLWGAPQDAPSNRWRARLRDALLGRALWLDASHVTEEKLFQFHEQLHQFRPKVIQAYARGLLVLARFIQWNGLKPYRPNSIVISAEGLEPEERALVEETFGAPIFNRYGCREVSVIASECEAHEGMHVMAEGLYVEIERDGRPARPGEVGSVLVTDLLNHAMPLIRYRIGDMSSWASGNCSCGRALPRLERVQGRVTDFLVGSDGRLVSGVHLATYVVANRPSLGQVQIRQSCAEEIQFRICPGPNFSEMSDLGYLEREAHNYLGAEMRVRHEIVSELSPQASGKFLFSQSTVTPQFLTARSQPVPAQ